MPYTSSVSKALYMRRFRADQKAKRLLLATVPAPGAAANPERKVELLLAAAKELGNDRVRRGYNFTEAIEYVHRITGVALNTR